MLHFKDVGTLYLNMDDFISPKIPSNSVTNNLNGQINFHSNSTVWQRPICQQRVPATIVSNQLGDLGSTFYWPFPFSGPLQHSAFCMEGFFVNGIMQWQNNKSKSHL